jgi:hypothetical protein
MSRFELNEAGIAQAIDAAAQLRVDELQAICDRVLYAGQGKSLDDVKALLRNDVRKTFGTEITDPDLSAYAEALASGRRVEVRLA